MGGVRLFNGIAHSFELPGTPVDAFGSELAILLNAPPSDLAIALPDPIGERLAEGITRIRAGDVHIEPGYDGRYGTVRVWRDDDDGGGQSRLL